MHKYKYVHAVIKDVELGKGFELKERHGINSLQKIYRKYFGEIQLKRYSVHFWEYTRVDLLMLHL